MSRFSDLFGYTQSNEDIFSQSAVVESAEVFSGVESAEVSAPSTVFEETEVFSPETLTSTAKRKTRKRG